MQTPTIGRFEEQFFYKRGERIDDQIHFTQMPRAKISPMDGLANYSFGSIVDDSRAETRGANIGRHCQLRTRRDQQHPLAESYLDQGCR